MGDYRSIVHYKFKKGMETKGLELLKRELIDKAKAYGCHSIELLQNDKNPSTIVGIAIWNSLDDARRFQTLWQEKEKELSKLCTESPIREFFKCTSHYLEGAKKVA